MNVSPKVKKGGGSSKGGREYAQVINDNGAEGEEMGAAGGVEGGGKKGSHLKCRVYRVAVKKRKECGKVV